MSPALRLVAILATAFVIASEAGASTLDPGSVSEARDIRLARWKWTEPGERAKTIATATATPAWLSRLARIVLRDSARVPDSACAVACGRCPDQVQASVSFTVDGVRYYLALFMREGLAALRSDTAVAFRFADASEEVARLLREVPGRKAFLDPTWQPPAAEPAPLSPDSAAFRGDEVFATGMPEVAHRVKPRYPSLAQSYGVAGTVDVYALVTAEGTVARVRAGGPLRQAEGPAQMFGGVLREAAMNAVRAWIFKPATCGGQPVAVWVMVPVRFSLR